MHNAEIKLIKVTVPNFIFLGWDNFVVRMFVQYPQNQILSNSITIYFTFVNYHYCQKQVSFQIGGRNFYISLDSKDLYRSFVKFFFSLERGQYPQSTFTIPMKQTGLLMLHVFFLNTYEFVKVTTQSDGKQDQSSKSIIIFEYIILQE